MFQPRSIQSSLSFKDKLFAIDYVLVFSILILGIVSMFGGCKFVPEVRIYNPWFYGRCNESMGVERYGEEWSQF